MFHVPLAPPVGRGRGRGLGRGLVAALPAGLADPAFFCGGRQGSS